MKEEKKECPIWPGIMCDVPNRECQKCDWGKKEAESEGVDGSK